MVMALFSNSFIIGSEIATATFDFEARILESRGKLFISFKLRTVASSMLDYKKS